MPPANRTAQFDIHGLPLIRTLEDLATHSRRPAAQLWKLFFRAGSNYRIFRLRKKSFGHRKIARPCGPLMALQRWVLRNILDQLRATGSCYGLGRDTSIRKHAEQHACAKAILTLDIEDFFPSISIARVTNVFRVAGYEPAIASILARLCTHQGGLPQGAPSSPKLANLACFRLDRRLKRFAEKQGFVYTRYVDDMSFSASSASRLAKAKPFIVHILRDSGFRVNHRKTRLMGPRQALKVTGLIVSPEAVGIGRRRLRDLRVRIHRIHTGAPDADMATAQGWLDFVSDADPSRYLVLVAYIEKLRASSKGSDLAGLRTTLAKST